MIPAIQAAKGQIYQIKRYKINHSKVDIYVIKLACSVRSGEILIEILHINKWLRLEVADKVSITGNYKKTDRKTLRHSNTSCKG